MDPARLNYLQSQQTDSVPTEEAPSFNPFNNGIRNAIESARVSLDMTEKQQDKAMRRSMLSFANAYSQEPRQKGLMANFGSVARSLAPAILEHDNSEDEAFKENNNLANQILAYEGAEKNRQAQQEERLWHRSHAEKQLAEQKRHHDMMSDYRHQKLNTQQFNTDPLMLNGIEVFPIQNRQELNAYSKDKKALGSILNEVNDLEKDYTTFRKSTSKNIFDPMSPVAGYTNSIKDKYGRFFESKKLKEETANLKTLNSKLNKFVISSERALKGGGVMGPRLIELFKEQGIYPSLEDDTPEIFESKLKMLKAEIENSYKAANLSLAHKVHIDPSQVENILGNLEEKNITDEISNIGTSNEDIDTKMIVMQNAQGKKFNIPEHEVQAAIDDKEEPLTIVEGQ